MMWHQKGWCISCLLMCNKSPQMWQPQTINVCCLTVCGSGTRRCLLEALAQGLLWGCSQQGWLAWGWRTHCQGDSLPWLSARDFFSFLHGLSAELPEHPHSMAAGFFLSKWTLGHRPVVVLYGHLHLHLFHSLEMSHLAESTLKGAVVNKLHCLKREIAKNLWMYFKVATFRISFNWNLI